MQMLMKMQMVMPMLLQGKKEKKRKQVEEKEKESIKRNHQPLHWTIDCHPFFDSPFSFFAAIDQRIDYVPTVLHSPHQQVGIIKDFSVPRKPNCPSNCYEKCCPVCI
jgi:hypothetical protein